MVNKWLAGGSDAAPTGPQASNQVRGMIGHQLNLTKMQPRAKRELGYFPATLARRRWRAIRARPRIPWWKGLGADSEEKREPVSDIDTAAADSLKVLDPKRPIREADMTGLAGPPASVANDPACVKTHRLF